MLQFTTMPIAIEATPLFGLLKKLRTTRVLEHGNTVRLNQVDFSCKGSKHFRLVVQQDGEHVARQSERNGDSGLIYTKEELNDEHPAIHCLFWPVLPNIRQVLLLARVRVIGIPSIEEIEKEAREIKSQMDQKRTVFDSTISSKK